MNPKAYFWLNVVCLKLFQELSKNGKRLRRKTSAFRPKNLIVCQWPNEIPGRCFRGINQNLSFCSRASLEMECEEKLKTIINGTFCHVHQISLTFMKARSLSFATLWWKPSFAWINFLRIRSPLSGNCVIKSKRSSEVLLRDLSHFSELKLN